MCQSQPAFLNLLTLFLFSWSIRKEASVSFSWEKDLFWNRDAFCTVTTTVKGSHKVTGEGCACNPLVLTWLKTRKTRQQAQPRKLLSNSMNKLISYRIFILMKCKLVFQLSFVGFKQTAASSAPVTKARQFLICMRCYFVASINILDGFFLVTIVKPRGICFNTRVNRN